jgi:serine O-acetyltransferase
VLRAVVAAQRAIHEDIRMVHASDPAAPSMASIPLLYPGLQAVWAFRLTSRLWRRGRRGSAIILARWVRRLTGVDIHPSARIGRRLFIDHGMGTTIGPYVDIGDDTLIYHGVVLGGGRSGERLRVGSRVAIGAGAAVVSPVSIGDGARIGANAVVFIDVPADATAVGRPLRVIAPATDRVALSWE